MDEEKISLRVKWGVGGLLLVCLALAIMLWKQDGSGSALWFVGLLVLTATALTLTAIVFGGLKLSDANEAFGLPSGSVRTLLAVGVMVLFAVFGLKFFGDTDAQTGASRLGDKPFAERIEVAPAKLAEELARYKESQSVLPVVVSPGRVASGTDAGANAVLNLYVLKSGRPAEAVDAQKQLLTAIITLLTTVVGFYFGSKSASDGLRARNDSTPTDPAAQQGQQATLAANRDALEAQIKTDRDTLSRLRALPASEGGAAGPIASALAQALDLDGKLDALRERLSTALTDAQAKLAAVAAAPSGGEAAARDAAQKALAQAGTELDALKQAAQQFGAATAQLLALTAKG